MSDLVAVNALVIEVISVFDANDNGVTGLINSNFTVYLYKNGVADATTVTVTEIANGQYMVTFTPGSAAKWAWRVSNATYNPRGWQASYQATLDGVLSLAGIAAAVWGFVVESANAITMTATRMLRIIAAGVGGAKATGSQSTIAYSDLCGDETMISGTANANGDRSGITYGP
jgi:hypothetical protein